MSKSKKKVSPAAAFAGEIKKTAFQGPSAYSPPASSSKRPRHVAAAEVSDGEAKIHLRSHHTSLALSQIEIDILERVFDGVRVVGLRGRVASRNNLICAAIRILETTPVARIESVLKSI